MTTYNLYRYRENRLAFVVFDEDESDFNARHLKRLREAIQDGEIEFIEVFDSKEALRNYIKDKSITLYDKSQIH